MKKAPFLFGSATSAHQVEGQNVHSDWWAWEQNGNVPESSANACNHYQTFRDDFQHASDLGHNAHRFSLEWSRFMPKPGHWDEEVFVHYEQVFKSLAEKNLEPIVTLHHFTHPQWFAEKGGWSSEENIADYLQYVDRVIKAYGKYVTYWVTFNEPMVYLYYGYFEGSWPPGEKDFPKALRVLKNLLTAHIRAYKRIHNYYETELHHDVSVSIAKHMLYFTPFENRWKDRLVTYLRGWFFNDLFLHALDTGFLFLPGVFCEPLEANRTLDFIGLNYYARERIQYAGLSGANCFGKKIESASISGEAIEVNQLGWEVSPTGLHKCLERLKRYRLPIMILENGICTQDDEQRSRFIQSHLKVVNLAQKEGIPVSGYFYWSLLDNFEWAEGFGPRFGIIDVDYASQARKVRRSAQVLTDFCRKLIR